MRCYRDSFCLHQEGELTATRTGLQRELSEMFYPHIIHCFLQFLSSLPCSLIDVTIAHRHLMWSSTSHSTSPHTRPLTSPALFAIKSSPASPASNLISCCMRRRRWVSRPIKHKTIVGFAFTTSWEELYVSLLSPLPTLLPTLQNLICIECGDEFILQSQLSLHLEDHRKELSGIKVYTCKTCDKEFKTSAHLKEHMKSHVKMRSGRASDADVFHLTESGGKLLEVKRESNSY